MTDTHEELNKMDEMIADYANCKDELCQKMTKKKITETRKKLMNLKKQSDLSRKYLMSVFKAMPVKKRGAKLNPAELTEKLEEVIEKVKPKGRRKKADT